MNEFKHCTLIQQAATRVRGRFTQPQYGFAVGAPQGDTYIPTQPLPLT